MVAIFVCLCVRRNEGLFIYKFLKWHCSPEKSFQPFFFVQSQKKSRLTNKYPDFSKMHVLQIKGLLPRQLQFWAVEVIFVLYIICNLQKNAHSRVNSIKTSNFNGELKLKMAHKNRISEKMKGIFGSVHKFVKKPSPIFLKKIRTSEILSLYFPIASQRSANLNPSTWLANCECSSGPDFTIMLASLANGSNLKISS